MTEPRPRYRFAAPKGAWRSVTITFRTVDDAAAKRIHELARKDLGDVGELGRLERLDGDEWRPV